MSSDELLDAWFLAAEQGHVEGLTRCLESNVDIESTRMKRIRINTVPQSALVRTVLKNHLEATAYLVDQGACMEIGEGLEFISTLCEASRGGRVEIARFLVSRGADIHAIDPYSHSTALHSIASKANLRSALEVCKLLVLVGVDLEAVNKQGNRALDCANIVAKNFNSAGNEKFAHINDFITFLSDHAPKFQKGRCPKLAVVKKQTPVEKRASTPSPSLDEGKNDEVAVDNDTTDVTAASETDETHASDSDAAGHIMLSYNWGHQDVIKRIAASLKSRGFKIWLDVEQMHGSTLATMADAVENSAVVVMAMSENYQKSANCRLEGEYALQQKKPVVPIMMENFRPSGWLGMLLGAKLYYPFHSSQLDDFEKAMTALAAGISHHTKSCSRSEPVRVPVDTVREPAAEPEKAPRSLPSEAIPQTRSSVVAPKALQWTSEDIKQAALEFGLTDETSEAFVSLGLDGSTVRELWFVRCGDCRYFDELCMKQLGVVSFLERLKFAAFLRSVFGGDVAH